MERLNFRELCRLIEDKEATMKFLIQNALILSKPKCKICNEEMRTKIRGFLASIGYRCTRKGNESNRHNVYINAFTNSWFSNRKLDIDKILIISYMFATGQTNYDRIIYETSTKDVTTSRETVSDWLFNCRKVTWDWAQKHKSENRIGGQGVVVVMRESKINQRKHNSAKAMAGTCIFGFFEAGADGGLRRGGHFRVEMCLEKETSQQAMLPLIQRHVLMGSVIVADQWEGCYRLVEDGFEPFTLTTKKEFMDSELGADKATVDSQWCALKMITGHRMRKEIVETHVCEFLWRKHVRRNNLDPFSYFLECVKIEYNPNIEQQVLETQKKNKPFIETEGKFP